MREATISREIGAIALLPLLRVLWVADAQAQIEVLAGTPIGEAVAGILVPSPIQLGPVNVSCELDQLPCCILDLASTTMDKRVLMEVPVRIGCNLGGDPHSV
tara:strand:+ start:2274 stop:2579 length:306 start_codon:yes stop_codon:yes gene_type:complete